MVVIEIICPDVEAVNAIFTFSFSVADNPFLYTINSVSTAYLVSENNGTGFPFL